MQKILVLGAGHSAPYLIHHLLGRAEELDWQVTVGDLDGDAAQRRVGDHPRGRAIAFDLRDDAACQQEMTQADVVVSLLPPQLQSSVARHAIDHHTHMVSASYRSNEMRRLHDEATTSGSIILCELGLDPGIDVMSAQAIIDDVHGRGGRITSFYSYGGGLPEPSFEGNPLRYVVTWNPRNVAMAGEAGACYLENGEFRLVPPHRIFESAWPVDVPGLGTMDGYANRDSLSYQEVHGLEHVQSLVRGTLRFPGYCHLWQQIVKLGLPNEALEVPDLGAKTWAQLTAMHLPPGPGDLQERCARYLGLEDDDPALGTLDWLGLFSDQTIDIRGQRPSQALTALLERRLPLPPQHRDMVVLHHELDIQWAEGSPQRLASTFIHFGEPGGMTGMAQTVGLPAALGVELILSDNELPPGVHVPVRPDLYLPILQGLEAHGMIFEETLTDLV